MANLAHRMDFQIRYMQRALTLAQKGAGKVAPNPMVGCVIVFEGQIIGEGYHHKFGGPHAEVVAINSVSDTSKLGNADVYVTLEPCSHFGKTPPCADLLVHYKVKRVIVGSKDPNPKVAGRGIKRLEEAGIEVITGVLNEEEALLNKRFRCNFTKKRPYIILKWAQTEDGFLARENFDSKWISDEYSRQLVHKYRSEEQAILVGYNTVLYDSPRLDVRDWSGNNPVRIILDPGARLDTQKLMTGNAKTYVFTSSKKLSDKNIEFIDIGTENYLDSVLEELYKMNVHSVFVEGGPKTLTKFISHGFWDEIRIFKSKQTFESGIVAPDFKGKLISTERIINDTLEIYHPL